MRKAIAGKISVMISFRNEIVTSNGGKQILVEDPLGHPIELFQPF